MAAFRRIACVFSVCGGRLALLLAAISVVAVLGCEVPAARAEQAAADDDNPHLWKPRTKSVAVFKNGLGFFIREGEVQVRDGWCVARHIHPAAFGTFAIYAHDQKHIGRAHV